MAQANAANQAKTGDCLRIGQLIRVIAARLDMFNRDCQQIRIEILAPPGIMMDSIARRAWDAADETISISSIVLIHGTNDASLPPYSVMSGHACRLEEA